MATNSDGGIVLSVSIDSSEISSDMKKVVSEINKQVQAEAKNVKAVESVNQAKEKTSQQQAKTNQEVYKEVEAEYKALTAEQNLATAKEKSAIVSAKKTVEEEKGYRALVQSEIAENNLQKSSNEVLISEQKLTQEKEKSSQAITQSEIKQQKLNQEVYNSVTAEEKKNKAILDTQKKQQDLLIGEQKLKKAIEDRAIAEEKHKQAIIKTEKAQQSLKKATNSVTTSIKQMATQLGIAFSIRQIIGFSKEAGGLASKTEASLARMSNLYGSAAQDVYDWANANSNALGMAKNTAYQAAAQYGNLFTTFANAQDSAKLSIDMLQVTAVIASQTGRTYEETFEKIQSGIYGNTRAIDDLGISVRKSSLMQTESWNIVSQGTKKWNDLTDAELQQLRVLGIIEQSTAKYGNTVMQTSALTRAQFNAAWTDFKATWGGVVNGVLIPVLNILTKIISAITVGLSWIAKFMGKSLELGKTTATVNTNTDGMADNIGTAANNQGKLTKGVKDTNKELKKTLAGFDELQILQGGDDKEDGSGSDGTSGGGKTATTIETADTGETTGDGYTPDVSPWKSAIAGLVEILVGVAFVALGLIICSMGHLALGVGTIAFGLFSIGVGLVTLGAAADASKAKEYLLVVEAITGTILLSIGVCLCAWGSLPWGIACIVGGVGLLGYEAYELLSGGLEAEQIMSVLSTLGAFLGGALLAIGAFLCFMSVYPMGIACIVAGAAALVGAGVAASKSDTKGVTDWLQLLLTVISGFLIVLGVILCIFGVFPLGIGLIVAGAVVLTVTLINKNDTLPQEIQNWINLIFAIVSVASLVIGIIMMCMGQITPLSIGLVAVGAIGLVAELAINWDFIKEKIKTVMNIIFEWLKVAAKLVLGVMLCMTGVGIPLGMALILSAAGDIWEAASVFWDKYGDKIKEVFTKIKDWLKNYGLLVLGVILCVSGVGLPLGLGLIAAGGVVLAKSQSPMWDTFKNKVKEVWEGIRQFWNNHIAKYFSKEWWKDLAVNAIKSFANWIIDGLNKLIRKINGLGFDLPEVLGGGHIGFSIPEIPRLAKGAVIPANHEFLAVLGDQKRGTNIEAPAELIKQMAMEAYQEMGLTSGQRQVVKEEHYYLNRQKLMSIVYELAQGGQRLKGTSLIDSGGVT